MIHPRPAKRPVRLLLVEDSAAEACLLRLGFESAGLDFALHVCDQGDEALAYLERAADIGRHPDLVLLDLHLPGLSGEEVLASIRADARLRALPVVVCTWSASLAAKVRCVELGANAFIEKPSCLRDYLQVGETVGELWAGLLGPAGEQTVGAAGL